MQVKRTLQSQRKRMTKIFPVVTVTGPRQSGKTTLCKMAFPKAHYLSLEDPELRTYANQDPRGFIDDHPGRTIIDEVQRVPDLLSTIQVAVDRKKEMGRFILAGSANLSLLDTVSQSLAGRTALLYPVH
jgi:predicted AAA+ superfamily ATPase